MTVSRPGATTATWMSPTATPGPWSRSTGTDSSPSPTTTPGSESCPRDYVRRHVELAYAATAHGVQGDTVTAAHLAVSEHTGAASAYVGDDPRPHQQHRPPGRHRYRRCPRTVGRGVRPRPRRPRRRPCRRTRRTGSRQLRPGPARSTKCSASCAARGNAKPDRWSDWHGTNRAVTRCARSSPWTAPSRSSGQPPRTGTGTRGSSTPRPPNRFERSTAMIAADTDRLREHMLSLWDADRPAAHTAAQVVTRGPGPLGLRLPAVNRAREELARWSVNGSPTYPTCPPTTTRSSPTPATPTTDRGSGGPSPTTPSSTPPPRTPTMPASSRPNTPHAPTATMPVASETTSCAATPTNSAATDHSPTPATPKPHLARAEHDIADRPHLVGHRTQRHRRLSAEPAIRALPAGRLAHEHDLWRADDDHARAAQHRRATAPHATRPLRPVHRRAQRRPAEAAHCRLHPPTPRRA